MITLFLISLHFILSLLLALLCLLKGTTSEFIFTLLICIFFPIGGYILTLLFFATKRSDTKVIEEDYFEEELLLFTDMLSHKNYQSIIPLEESLLINSNQVKRTQIIDSLKEDTFKYIDVLKFALKDDDVETSHYASSAISEITRKLNLQLQYFSTEHVKNRLDIPFLKEYASILNSYLSSGLLDTYSSMRYSYTYFEILTDLLELSSEKETYIDLIECCFMINRLDKVRIYCEEFLQKLECEEAYIKNLKYFYTIKDKEKFYLIFNQLRQSSIILSKEGLDLIRFWMEAIL